MYLAVVVLLMVVLPAGSVAVDHLRFDAAEPLVALVGKWFVFWGVGIRLLVAGLRQFLQPGFTAREIFDLQGEDALPLVRELGVANFATGVVGTASLWMPGFALPAAISAGIFFGVAGIRHLAAASRSRNEFIAMISDLFIFLVLAVFVAWSLAP